MVRDIVLLVLLVVAILLMLFIFIKVSAVLRIARQTIQDAEEILTTISERVVSPAASRARPAMQAGKIAGFLFRLLRRRSKGEASDGQ
jgi:hypothetical protein